MVLTNRCHLIFIGLRYNFEQYIFYGKCLCASYFGWGVTDSEDECRSEEKNVIRVCELEGSKRWLFPVATVLVTIAPE